MTRRVWLSRELWLAAAVLIVVTVLIIVLLDSRGASPTRVAEARHAPSASHQVATTAPPTGGGARQPTGGRGLGITSTLSANPGHPKAQHDQSTTAAGTLTLRKAIGQLIISTYAGPIPPQAVLDAVKKGQTGAVILMGDDTTGGISGTRAAVDELQAAARAGHNPGLLVMTDQEGGEVTRLPGPPGNPASAMANYQVAHEDGILTGRMLKAAGVNMDLAPVADVTRVDGFMTREQRTFGDDPAAVAKAACSFALGLQQERVGYTLKHFPGLGDAIRSTDDVPVAIIEPASEIYADDNAYRQCGHGSYASVMVSSASYSNLTGGTPAVLSPTIYHRIMREDKIDALTISDSFESGAIDHIRSPALAAINAGLDMVMYPGEESSSAYAYAALLQDVAMGALSTKRVFAAATRVLALKRALGLRG